MNKKLLFWFRQDLRLSDNPGLYQAAEQGQVMPVYILDDESPEQFKMGLSSRYWLHHSLTALDKDLKNNLNLYQGNAEKIIIKLVKEHGIEAVYWSRCYEPWRIESDTHIKTTLKSIGVECISFNASLLWEPWQVFKSDKTPYKVFTPFYRRGCLSAQPPRIPLSKPKKLDLIKDGQKSLSLEDLQLIQKPTEYFKEYDWQIGEHAAHKVLNTFLHDGGFDDYKEGRNFPAKKNVSRLSPYLHFGEISPNQVWYAAQEKTDANKKLAKDGDHFLSELGWREFSYSLLYNFPQLPHKNFQAKFDHFLWHNNQSLLKAWQQGQTGYPIVDAGMRELLQTGYMHNRVRMIVGSFLIKNLLLHWHHGEAWFWEYLVDADLASNSASWQWVAGSGADAAPYFRIFNPITQGEKFDEDGLYTKRFVPELSKLPKKYLFAPWQADPLTLKAAGIVLGKTYPMPIVDLAESRDRALEAFRSLPKEDPS